MGRGTLLFIPMYNCEKQIVRVLDQLTGDVCAFLSGVIIVNNRSTDQGEQAVTGYLQTHALPIPVRLLRNDDNYGLGGSHKVAFQYAIENDYDYVIVLHGDDQGNIRDVLPILSAGEHRLHDSMLGSRFEKQSVLVNYSRFRIFGNHVFNGLVSACTAKRLTDLGSGLNIYCTDYLRSEFYLSFPNTLTFNVYMLLYGVYSKSSFAFFPLTWREEDQISNAKFMKQSMEILKLVCRYVFDRKRLFSLDTGDARQYTYQVIWPGEAPSRRTQS